MHLDENIPRRNDAAVDQSTNMADDMHCMSVVY